MSMNHNAGGVYGPARVAVNRNAWPHAGLYLLLALAATGCTAPPKTRPPYPVGVWYGLETAAACARGDLDHVVDQDFNAIARLGFDTVFVRHIRDADRPRVAEAAHRGRLSIALPSRDVVYYIRTGRLPDGCRDVAAMADAGWRSQGASRSAIALIGEACDAATTSRVGQVAAALGRHGDPNVTFAVAAPGTHPEVALVARPIEAAGARAAGDAMLLRCAVPADGPDDVAGRRWLAQYHAGLAAGLTGGIIVDGVRLVPGRWRGLAEAPDPPSAKLATAIRRITTRAAAWGPKLRRLSPGPLQPVGHGSDRLSLVLFSGAKRRFALLSNTSPDQYLHRTVQLPATLDSRPVRRAVLVPPEEHVVAGQVISVSGGKLTLPAELAPGDASLWEIF